MQYVVGVIILGFVWLPFYLLRKDLRKDMVWSGLYYLVILSLGFVLIKLVAPNMPPEQTIVPGYWDPDTLFNLGRITGGYAIEDAVYIFFTGGIAAAVYETFFRKKLGRRHVKHRPHYALILGAIAGGLVGLMEVNLIYALIAFGFAVALVIWIQRRDLIQHSLAGGVSYLLVYIVCAFIFLNIYPDYITTYYRVANLSGILLFTIPIEEFLFALSFGLSWSPIYEYVKDIKGN
jgi:hypothetical protein